MPLRFYLEDKKRESVGWAEESLNGDAGAASHTLQLNGAAPDENGSSSSTDERRALATTPAFTHTHTHSSLKRRRDVQRSARDALQARSDAASRSLGVSDPSPFCPDPV